MRHTQTRAGRPDRPWPATVAMLVLGATIGAVVGMTSRPARPPVFDEGVDDETPQPPDAAPATGDDYRDAVADDDGWPRAR